MSGAISATTLATVAGIGAAGSIGGALIGSNAAGNAAQTQANAADQAAQLQYKASQDALAQQQKQFDVNQQNIAPWLQAGQNGLSQLQALIGTQANPGPLMQAYPGGQFTAPTAAEAAATPGYQFQLQQGQDAIERSAAVRGGLLTGGTLKALDDYSQGLASSNYQNAYNNALNTYGTNYNTWANQNANEFNRLAALSGAGQTAANTLSTLGQNNANATTANLLGTASAMGQQLNNAGAANASGIVGAGNAWSQGLSGLGGNLSNLLLLSQLGGGGYGGRTLFPAGNELGG